MGTRRQDGERVRALAAPIGPRRARSPAAGRDGPRPDGAAYRRSLPLAGEQGTVADRMNGTAADGSCRDQDRDPDRRQRAVGLLQCRAR